MFKDFIKNKLEIRTLLLIDALGATSGNIDCEVTEYHDCTVRDYIESNRIVLKEIDSGYNTFFYTRKVDESTC